MADNKDYHGHPNYNVVFAALVVLMLISVGLDMMDSILGMLLIFGVSIVKAYLVMANFMHLKYEPKLLDLFPYLSVALMIILFFGVAPDSIFIPLKIVQ